MTPLPTDLQPATAKTGAVPRTGLQDRLAAVPTLVVRAGPDPGMGGDGEDEEADQRPLDLGIIRRIMAYTRPYARQRNWLIAAVLLRGAQIPLGTWLIGHVIQGPIARGDERGTLAGAITFGLVAVWTAATFYFRALYPLVLGEAVIHDLRAEVFAHLQKMTMSFYHQTKLGSIISRMTSDVEAVRIGVQDVLFVSLVLAGQMVVSAVMMAVCDWVLFCAVVAIAPLLWLINRHFRGQLSTAYREQQESFSRITATLAESVNGIRVTQGFVRQKVNADLFRDLVADHFRYNFSAARLTAVFLPLLELNSQCFIAVLLLLGGWRALDPHVAMPVGNLIQFFFLAALFFQPVTLLGQQYNSALTAMAGAERVFKLLDRRPDWEDAPGVQVVGPIRGQVEFRGVGFEYVPGKPVLHGIDFTAAPGQTIALVGHTGSGKSSIINLVSKFYLPTAGEILIDGQEIRALTTESLHAQMAIVSQQNFLFSGTVAENIRFGRPLATDEELREVCRRLDCLDLLEGGLPQGLNTSVGEHGGAISAGQRQIVCFARALLADPRILILDEATSAIDALTEERLQKALALLLTGRTSFVVAHRLSTIRHADQALVLVDGRIVERGSHESLLTQNGVYAGLYREFVRQAEG